MWIVHFVPGDREWTWKKRYCLILPTQILLSPVLRQLFEMAKSSHCLDGYNYYNACKVTYVTHEGNECTYNAHIRLGINDLSCNFWKMVRCKQH